MDDAKIIELFWNRNDSAISETSIKYGQTLKHISFGILLNNEDSEECVNDAFLKAWNSIPPQKPNSLIAYLGRITRNISINRWYENRAKKRSRDDELISELLDCIPSSQTVESEIETSELTELIVKWLNSLPKVDRILFIRRYWFDESLINLASECQTTPNKLAGRMYRLRKKLKSALEKEGIRL